MPDRSVNNRAGHIIGHFPSLKLKRMVAFQSTLGRDYLYMLDYSSQVLSYKERPLTITYQNNGRPRRFTPDFLVTTPEALTLVDCSAEAYVNDEENTAKFEAARVWCADHTALFQIITDRELYAGHMLTNVKLLTRYAHHTVSPDFSARVFGSLAVLSPPISLGDLARSVDALNPSAAAANILHLIFHHILMLDLKMAPISGTSIISLVDTCNGGHSR